MPNLNGSSNAQASLKEVGFTNNFKFMTLNTGLSRAGTAAFALAIIWIALTITRSPVIAGFADGMATLPLIFSFAFGAYIDNVGSKRTIAISADIGRALAVLGLLFAILSNDVWVKIFSIYSVGFMIGMTSDILNSVRASWTKQFLSEEQYKKGSSVIQSVTSLAQAAGFALSGLFLVLGLYFTIYGLAFIFFLSLIPIIPLKDDKIPRNSEKEKMRSSIISGLKFIGENKTIKAIIIIGLLTNFSFGTVGIFFAVLVNVKFGLPAIYYGMLYVTITLGIIAGSVVGAKVKGKMGIYTVALVFAIGTILFIMGFLKYVYLDYACAFSLGILIGVVNVIISTGMIKSVTQEMMARVQGAFSTFALTMTFFSGAIGGLLIKIFSLDNSFYIIGSVMALVSFLPFFFKDFYNMAI